MWVMSPLKSVNVLLTQCLSWFVLASRPPASVYSTYLLWLVCYDPFPWKPLPCGHFNSLSESSNICVRVKARSDVCLVFTNCILSLFVPFCLYVRHIVSTDRSWEKQAVSGNFVFIWLHCLCLLLLQVLEAFDFYNVLVFLSILDLWDSLITVSKKISSLQIFNFKVLLLYWSPADMTVKARKGGFYNLQIIIIL